MRGVPRLTGGPPWGVVLAAVAGRAAVFPALVLVIVLLVILLVASLQRHRRRSRHRRRFRRRDPPPPRRCHRRRSRRRRPPPPPFPGVAAVITPPEPSGYLAASHLGPRPRRTAGPTLDGSSLAASVVAGGCRGVVAGAAEAAGAGRSSPSVAAPAEEAETPGGNAVTADDGDIDRHRRGQREDQRAHRGGTAHRERRAARFLGRLVDDLPAVASTRASAPVMSRIGSSAARGSPPPRPRRRRRPPRRLRRGASSRPLPGCWGEGVGCVAGAA